MKYRVKRHTVCQPLDQSYRLIPLTRRQNAIVDVENFEWLSQWNWHALWNKCTHSFYAYRGCANGNIMIGMHAVILGCERGEWGDHKNHNTLDNRRENLRKVTALQNSANRKLHSNNRAGFKGVSREKGTQKWRSRICHRGTQIYIGLFASKKEAARAYDEMAKKYHGEFAGLNFPSQ